MDYLLIREVFDRHPDPLPVFDRHPDPLLVLDRFLADRLPVFGRHLVSGLCLGILAAVIVPFPFDVLPVSYFGIVGVFPPFVYVVPASYSP